MKAPSLLGLLLLSCGQTNASVDAPAQDALEVTPGATELEALFASADRDPSGLVPLLLEASARIATLDGDQGHALADRLEPYSRRVFFGTERLPGMERVGLGLHTVQPGELPGKIARRYGISSELFGYLNAGYDERRLGAGTELKVLDLSSGSLSLLIDRTRYRLSAWRSVPDGTGGERWVLVAYLPVGLGAPETRTPLGTTRITLRARNPEWTHPVTRVVYAPEDPGNLLGGYWMALAEEGIGKRGIGFHGYTGDQPEAWLEQPKSNGCVRMRQADMDRIFHLALEGTPVSIAP